MAKWINLADSSGARLRLASIPVNGTPTVHLFITNLAFTNAKWDRSINELGFRPGPSRRYLVRRPEAGERVLASTFSKVFPMARLVDMDPIDYSLNALSGPSKTASSAQARSTDIEMRGVHHLGRNPGGLEVYDSLSGRFYVNGDERVMESSARAPVDFLRIKRSDEADLSPVELQSRHIQLATGFVKSMDLGEVQHSEDYSAWRDAIYPGSSELNTREIDAALFSAIDSALIRHVRSQHDVAPDAYGPMARLYDYLPPYQGSERGLGAMPQPLSVAAQRLLGDTAGKVVLYPNAFDGASFAFLPQDTQIRAFGLQSWRRFSLEREGVEWGEAFNPLIETGADAMLYNADPEFDANGVRQDYRGAIQAMRCLQPGARAILVLAADAGQGRQAGQVASASRRFFETISEKYTIDEVFETAPILSRKSGGGAGLRVIALRNLSPEGEQQVDSKARLEKWLQDGFPLLSSWDAVKTQIDEAITRINVREAQSAGVALERALANESYQKPYIAFSKLGEPRTMSPANIQSAAQSYLTKVESLYGGVDDYVSNQLGMGLRTLESRFAPEQIDGIAVMLSRYAVQRSSILADDTGIGKGRQLAAISTWANKHGHDVFFVTERATLFSDLARDLNDIGEWDRFRPLVINTDGEITVEGGPGAELRVLAKGTSPARMREII